MFLSRGVSQINLGKLSLSSILKEANALVKVLIIWCNQKKKNLDSFVGFHLPHSQACDSDGFITNKRRFLFCPLRNLQRGRRFDMDWYQKINCMLLLLSLMKLFFIYIFYCPNICFRVLDPSKPTMYPPIIIVIVVFLHVLYFPSQLFRRYKKLFYCLSN